MNDGSASGENLKFEISDLKGECVATDVGGDGEDGLTDLKFEISDLKKEHVATDGGGGGEGGARDLKLEISDLKDEISDLKGGRGEGGGGLNGRKRWGKIARMPFDVRESLNEQIRDGVQYKEISAALKAKGFDGVTKFDLSTWRRGGHQEWLRDQERIAALRNDVGRAVKVVGELSENEAEGVERLNEMLIGMQIVNALQDLQRGTLKKLVEAKPELLFRIARVASDQARDRARRKRANLLVRRSEGGPLGQKAEPILDAEPGLTPETLLKIEAAMARCCR